MTWRRVVVRAAAAHLFLALSRVAAAQPVAGHEAPVVLDLVDCNASFSAELRRIASLELHAVVVEPERPQSAGTWVSVACRAAQVELEVRNAVTAKHLQRTVPLSYPASSARARLVALAVAELVVASWEELEGRPEPLPQATPTPPAEPEPLVTGSGPAKPIPVAEALGDARFLTASRFVLFGGGVRSGFRLHGHLAARLDAFVDFGDASRSLGRVSIEAIHGGAAIGWAVDEDWWLVAAWLGARAGYVRLRGVPSTGAAGHIETGSWIGPDVGVDVVFWPHRLLHAAVGAAAGAVLLGVRGQVEGDEDVSVLGLWAALTAGVGLSLP